MRPVEKAIITHSHSDHARGGSKEYLTAGRNVNLLKERIGKGINVTGLEYGKHLTINSVKVSLHPAGHIPGSSQVRLEYKGKVCVISGDYKLGFDGLTEEFEPVKCDVFVTETTFALPIFNWDPQEQVKDRIVKWWQRNASDGNVCVLGAYSLGKAQRLLKLLGEFSDRIFVHNSVARLNEIIKGAGYILPEAKELKGSLSKKELEGALIIAPTSYMNSAASARLGDYETAFASGWMAVRGSRRWQSFDAGFGISDHADWIGLNEAITMTGAETVYAVHGFTDVFTRWLNERGIKALSPKTKYFSERSDD